MSKKKTVGRPKKAIEVKKKITSPVSTKFKSTAVFENKKCTISCTFDEIERLGINVKDGEKVTIEKEISETEVLLIGGKIVPKTILKF
jgi:hypothetical protein